MGKIAGFEDKDESTAVFGCTITGDFLPPH